MTDISVIIPAYNRADLLPRTLDSVARQTLRPREVIIVNDRSPDNTHEVCAALIEQYNGQLNIIYVLHDVNKGEGGSRNTGIRMAQGDYVAFLDSDDEWRPEKLEKQAAFLAQNKVDGVFCESYLVENGDYDHASLSTIDHDLIVSEHLLTRGCGYGTGTNLLMSRRAIGNHFFDEALRLFVDVDWLYRVSQTATLHVMHEGLAYYHKAPMRDGAYVKERADIFMEKYKPVIANWRWYKRQQVHAYMDWNVAFGYQGNRHYFMAAYYFFRGIIKWPVRHPKYYLFVPLNILKGIVRWG
jgi:glycosyltransferase involved in cell wall biosynthesis